MPVGVLLGLIAGYRQGTRTDTIIMRITDIFLAVPPLILALAIASVLEPNLINSMIAVSLMWWPWYTRLVYGQATALRNEFYVSSAEVTGASTPHILFREISSQFSLAHLYKNQSGHGLGDHHRRLT